METSSKYSRLFHSLRHIFFSILGHTWWTIIRADWLRLFSFFLVLFCSSWHKSVIQVQQIVTVHTNWSLNQTCEHDVQISRLLCHSTLTFRKYLVQISSGNRLLDHNQTSPNLTYSHMSTIWCCTCAVETAWYNQRTNWINLPCLVYWVYFI